MEVADLMESEKEAVRRVQVTGRGSYIVSLPKRWVESVGLSRGESIVVSQMDDSSLILTPRKLSLNSREKQVSVNIVADEDLESVIRKVISYYLVGFNVIQLRSMEGRLSSAQKSYIKENIRSKLVGSEIITESQDTITVQVLLSYPELTVDNALRRMIVIATSMHEDAINALKTLDKDLAEDVIKMDEEVDRFSFYIIRQLKLAVQHQPLIREIGLNNPRDCLGFRLITKSVERIADHATNIARNVLTIRDNIKPELYSKIHEMSSLATLLFKEAGKALFSRNYRLAEEVLKKSKGINTIEMKTINHLIKERLSPTDISRLRLILESVRRIAEYSTDIAEIILNLTVVGSGRAKKI